MVLPRGMRCAIRYNGLSLERRRMETGLCAFLPWDSAFFGFKIARLTPNRMTPDSISTAFEWCRLNEIDCLYFLAESDHRETVRVAEASGFQFVDIRVTLAHRGGSEANPGEPHDAVRLFHEADLASLKLIARESHRDSRFFFDGRFPEERCEDLFQTWIERSCSGWAQAVFVAEVNRVACGYCTCHIDSGAGRIGLVALARHAQGRMLGRHLLDAATSYFSAHGIAPVKVATQGRNARAQRLYEECGFVTDSVMLWYHKWFRAPARP